MEKKLTIYLLGGAIFIMLFSFISVFKVQAGQTTKEPGPDNGTCVQIAEAAAEDKSIAQSTEEQGGSAATTDKTAATESKAPAIGSQTIGIGVSFLDSIDSSKKYSFSEYVRGLYSFSMKLAIVLAILMVIYAGYKYMTSRGESSAINEAKDIIFSTLLGAALLMLVVLLGQVAGLNINITPTTISAISIGVMS